MGERTVNARQLKVLEWVVAGCPEGVMTGTTHKTSAVALQSRRLVKVSKRRGAWRAEATEAGRFFVEHGAYPAGHWANRIRPASQPATAATPRRPVGERKVTGRQPVDQMLSDLAEAGAELHVAVPAGAGNYWENLAASAIRHGKVPAGKTLTVGPGTTWTERVIRLEDAPAWMTVVLEPVPVASSLRSPHPVVRALRDDKNRLPLKGARIRLRALRILDAIAKSALARGYSVTAPKAEPGSRRPSGQLVVTIGRHTNTLTMEQLNDRVPHKPTKHELERQERYSWATIPTHDQVPSDRLRIKLERGWKIRQDTFADTKTITLESRLPHLLQELELRAAAAEDHTQRREHEAQERERRWELARGEAIVQAREHHRAKVLTVRSSGGTRRSDSMPTWVRCRRGSRASTWRSGRRPKRG